MKTSEHFFKSLFSNCMRTYCWILILTVVKRLLNLVNCVSVTICNLLLYRCVCKAAQWERVEVLSWISQVFTQCEQFLFTIAIQLSHDSGGLRWKCSCCWGLHGAKFSSSWGREKKISRCLIEKRRENKHKHKLTLLLDSSCKKEKKKKYDTTQLGSVTPLMLQRLGGPVGGSSSRIREAAQCNTTN